MVVQEESEYIMVETLSDELVKGKAPEGVEVHEYDIDGLSLRLGLIKR
jgi:hypothetical protein